jgi:N utilization substance protein B
MAASRRSPGGAKTKEAAGGANKRGAARLAAVQALYQMDVAATTLRDVMAEFEQFRLGKELDGDLYRAADVDWFRDLVSGVVREQKLLDPYIHTALVSDWPLKRVDTTLRAILRAGAFELLHRKDVPARVVISEYVDVAHAFFEGDEPKLVNGVLDRLAHEMRPSEFEGDAAAKRK